MIWILFAAITITGLIILSGVEYGKRLAAEHRVATLEAGLTALEDEPVGESARCKKAPHYDGACECEERLAAVVTHTMVSEPMNGPPYCRECSEAIAEWVPWSADWHTSVIPSSRGGAS